MKAAQVGQFLFLIFLCIGLGAKTQAQGENTERSLPQWHLTLGYGIGSTSLFGKEQYAYDYDVRLYSLAASFQLFEKKNWTGRIVLIPQYNTSYYFSEPANAYLDGFEYGVNAGLRIHYSIFRMSPYILASLGPHYISGSPDRQAPGFIFSDNIGMGLEYSLNAQWQLSAGAGFRHLSNASLKKPNGGINSFIYSMNLSYRL